MSESCELDWFCCEDLLGGSRWREVWYGPVGDACGIGASLAKRLQKAIRNTR